MTITTVSGYVVYQAREGVHNESGPLIGRDVISQLLDVTSMVCATSRYMSQHATQYSCGVEYPLRVHPLRIPHARTSVCTCDIITGPASEKRQILRGKIKHKIHKHSLLFMLTRF